MPRRSGLTAVRAYRTQTMDVTMLSISAPATSAGLPPQDDILASAAVMRGNMASSAVAQRPLEIIGSLIEKLARHASGEQPLSRGDLLRLVLSLGAVTGVSWQTDESLRAYTQRIARALEAILPEISAGATANRSSSADPLDRGVRQRPDAASPPFADGRAGRPGQGSVSMATTLPRGGAEATPQRILPPQGPVLTPVMIQALVAARATDAGVMQAVQQSAPRRKEEEGTASRLTEGEEGVTPSAREGSRGHTPRPIPAAANLSVRPQQQGAPSDPQGLRLTGAPLTPAERIEPTTLNSAQSGRLLQALAASSAPENALAHIERLQNPSDGGGASDAADPEQGRHGGADAVAADSAEAAPHEATGDTEQAPAEGDDNAFTNQRAGDRAEIDSDGTYRITNPTEEMLAETGLAELFRSESDAAEIARGADATTGAQLPGDDESLPADGSTPLRDDRQAGSLSDHDRTLLDEAERAAAPTGDAGSYRADMRSDEARRTYRDPSQGAAEAWVEGRAESQRALASLPAGTIPTPFPGAFSFQGVANGRGGPSHTQTIDPVDSDASGEKPPREQNSEDPDQQEERGEHSAKREDDTQADAVDASGAYHLYHLLGDAS